MSTPTDSAEVDALRNRCKSLEANVTALASRAEAAERDVGAITDARDLALLVDHQDMLHAKYDKEA
jgi:hypothetical protein